MTRKIRYAWARLDMARTADELSECWSSSHQTADFSVYIVATQKHRCAEHGQQATCCTTFSWAMQSGCQVYPKMGLFQPAAGKKLLSLIPVFHRMPFTTTFGPSNQPKVWILTASGNYFNICKPCSLPCSVVSAFATQWLAREQSLAHNLKQNGKQTTLASMSLCGC